MIVMMMTMVRFEPVDQRIKSNEVRVLTWLWLLGTRSRRSRDTKKRYRVGPNMRNGRWQSDPLSVSLSGTCYVPSTRYTVLYLQFVGNTVNNATETTFVDSLQRAWFGGVVKNHRNAE